MNPGSREWIVRSLSDWAAEARHGLALVTYKSHAARERTIRELQACLSAKGLDSAVLRCGEFDTKRMVDELAKADCDVLILTDQELLLFGGVANDEARTQESALARYWFNFSREHVTQRRGSQIWWFTPEAGARFLRGMPDLGRFFLMRQHLEDVVEDAGVQAEALDRTQLDRSEPAVETPSKGAAERARNLLARALRAASRSEPDVVRVWVELAGPSIELLLESGLGREAVSAFDQVRTLTGEPEASILAAFEEEPFGEACCTLCWIGDVHERAGRVSAARAAYLAAQNAATKLAELEPESTAFLSDLSLSYDRLADLDLRVDAARARGGYKKSLEILERLAALEPESTTFLRDLSIAYGKLADLDLPVDAARAREGYKKWLEIATKLAELEPENTTFLRDLSISYDRLADLDLPVDAARAREGHKQSLEIRTKLAEREPENTTFLRDLSISYDRLAALDLPVDAARARDGYNKSLEIVMKLAELEPENTTFLRDMSVCYEKLADLDRSVDAARAREGYRRSLEISTKLVELEPQNRQFRDDLAFFRNRLVQLPPNEAG